MISFTVQETAEALAAFMDSAIENGDEVEDA
jgi:hypothetical protein